MEPQELMHSSILDKKTRKMQMKMLKLVNKHTSPGNC
jgi:hypothetical protein